ncbi:hypothetical protein [Sulfurimonas sp. HSL-1716]|uniref:hypothetical protein n=1 Tax=Hydrocurvibacter sulfurireducens TaxID=3131937 RepID=UPI0031F9B618
MNTTTVRKARGSKGMPHNNFNDINYFSTLIAFLAGSWGAALNFFRRDHKDRSFFKKLGFFIMDMFINVGLTMLAYIGLIGYGLNDLLAVAIAGFVGHQGTRTFYLMELIITEKLGAKQTFDEIKEEIHR